MDCTRCPKLSAVNAEVVIQCGTIFEPKGFDISRLCHSNLSRSEGHSFLSMAKKGFSGGQLHLLEQQQQWGSSLSSRIKILWLLASDCQILDPRTQKVEHSNHFYSGSIHRILSRRSGGNITLWALNAILIIKSH